MALRRWLTLLWWWIAGWLQRGAAFFARQAAQQAGRAQLTLPPAGEQPETPSPSARPTTPGTPPAHWLEHVRSAGPPADWLARVQATAPELAEAARRPPDVTHTPFSDVRQRARLAGARPVSPRGFEKVQGLRRLVYDSQDYAEGIRAFKEKRGPRFVGR